MRSLFLAIRHFIFVCLHAVARVVPHSSRLTVLMYHSVSDSGDFFGVPASEFRRQVRYAKAQADVINIETLLAHMRGKPLLRDAVVFTFDDGYADFKDTVVPILKEENVPGAVFVLAGEPDRKELGNNIPVLAASDFKALMVPMIEVGSHAMTHKKITRLSESEAAFELAESRRIIEEYAQRPRFFAYPKGSHNRNTRLQVIEAGYEAAFTAEAHSVRGSDVFEIPRIQIDRTTSFSEFKAKLSPASDWYYAVWHLLKRMPAK